MKKYVKIINVIVMYMIIVLCIPELMISAKNSNDKSEKQYKVYPERDTNLEKYKYLTNAPEIIYNTTGEKNGLGGNCYYIEGKVVGVYKSGYKAMKAIGNTNAAKKMKDSPATKTIIIETQYGKVLINDIYSYLISNYKKILDDKTISEMKKEYVYFSKYKDFPKAGEKVKIIGVYQGYSEVAQMPSFIYGINDLVIPDEKKEVAAEKKNIKYTYGNISMEIPETWGKPVINDDYEYFYPGLGMMMLYRVDGITETLNQTLADSVVQALEGSNNDFELTSSTKKEYPKKAISQYFLYVYNNSYKTESGKLKCKNKLAIFKYKNTIYLFSYIAPKDSDNKEYFDAYNQILKTIKPKS